MQSLAVRGQEHEKSPRPSAEGGGDDIHEVIPSGAGGGVDGHAVGDAEEEARERGGVGGFGKVALFLCASEPFGERGFAGAALGDGGAADAVGVVAAGECALHEEAAAGIFWIGHQLCGAAKQMLRDFARGRLLEGLADMTAGLLGVTLERLLKEGLLVAKGGVHAGAVDAHRLGKHGQRRTLITLLPENVHGGVERGVGIEGPWAATQCGEVGTVAFDALSIEHFVRSAARKALISDILTYSLTRSCDPAYSVSIGT